MGGIGRVDHRDTGIGQRQGERQQSRAVDGIFCERIS
jgi:hypothetical protein